MALWLEIRKALGQPEYVHVLLNPLPIYGLAGGLFAYLAALAARSRPAQALALSLILAAAASAWPVAHFGHAAYDRVYSMSGAPARAWLNWHQNLAQRALWACTATALLSAAGLGCLWKAPRRYPVLASAAVASAVASLTLSGLCGFAAGKIRHSEFRSGPPPAWADTSSDED